MLKGYYGGLKECKETILYKYPMLYKYSLNSSFIVQNHGNHIPVSFYLIELHSTVKINLKWFVHTCRETILDKPSKAISFYSDLIIIGKTADDCIYVYNIMQVSHKQQCNS